MKYSFQLRKKVASLSVSACVASMITCTSAIAQQSTAVPSTLAQSTSSNASSTVIRSDGSLEAHLGAHKYKDGLYVKALPNGEDKLILNEPKSIRDLSFSPDGSKILFLGSDGLTRYYAHNVYTVNIDGSDLKQLSGQFVSKKDSQNYDVQSPSYSPDGSKVLVNVVERHETTTNTGEILALNVIPHIGLLSTSKAQQEPELLAVGTPLFWSVDGNSIYYVGKDPLISRLDITTKQSAATAIAGTSIPVLGRVPGMNAIFLGPQKEKAVTIENLDGSAVSPELTKLAADIPVKDADGRVIQAIQGIGSNKLLLSYEGGAVVGTSKPQRRSESMDFNNQ